MQKQELIAIRDVQADDKSFIFATLLRGIYYGDSWLSRIPKNIFMAEYHKVVDFMLQLPSTVIKVACLKDDPEVILGYAILGDSTRLHYVFVKKAWRGIGIAKSLVPPTVRVATHLTDVGISLLSKHPEVVFNPFALN